MTEKWQETIVETYGLVQRIDERTLKTDKAVGRAFKKLDDHDERIHVLETQEVVEEEKQKWIQKNPIKTGVAIGGVSLTTLLTIIGIVLKALGIV